MSERKGYHISDQYATYFLTFTIVAWVDLFTRKEICEIIIDSLKYCQKKKGLILNAYVIMSSHIHLVVSANEMSDGLSVIVRDFKKYTSKEIIKWVRMSFLESRKDWLEVVFRYHSKYNKNNKSYKVWQDSNQPKILLHPKFILQKINYIHNNPVKAGLVRNSKDYLYSSSAAYEGEQENLLNIDIIDLGIQEGYLLN